MTHLRNPQSKTLLIAVGSQNPIKIAAVNNAFMKVFPEYKLQIQGVAVASGVSDQPMSDEESLKGSTKRAYDALKAVDADYNIGLEAGLQKIGDLWFTSGWAVILSKEKVMSMGTSIRMIVPPQMMALIHNGYELGKANDIVFNTENSKHATGMFGLMTNDAITRQSCYRDGIIAALSRFIHPELF